MRRKAFFCFFLFWWAVMFPVLNFSEQQLVSLQKENVQYKSFLMEILH